MDNAEIMLKADMHLHTHEDPKDHRQVKYTVFELIDILDKQGFNVLSITLHDHMYDKDTMQRVREYAKEKGMIYIPGVEKTIEGNHVLLYNFSKEDAEKIGTYVELKNTIEKYNTQGFTDFLVVAAHPFYPSSTAIGKRFHEHHGLFHAIEHNSFYLSFINFNRKAHKAAKKYDKPIIGNTDAHVLEQLNHTFTNIKMPIKESAHPVTIVEFKQHVKKCSQEQYDEMIVKILRNIKKGNIELKTRPLSPFYVAKTVVKFTLF